MDLTKFSPHRNKYAVLFDAFPPEDMLTYTDTTMWFFWPTYLCDLSYSELTHLTSLERPVYGV